MEGKMIKRLGKINPTEKNLSDITNWYQKNREFYKRLALKVELIIKDILESENISYHDVTSRAKDIKSFIEKASKEKYDDPINEIMDLAGIRVTAYVESDVKKISKIIEREFSIFEEHSGDKSEILGENQVGYRSVHYVAKFNEERSSLSEYRRFKDALFEVQVRTILQHAWAEIEHDRNYKLKGELPERKDIKRRFSLLAASLEIADREFDSIVNDIDVYIEDIKEDTKKGHLDIPIDSISLKEYLDNKLVDIEIEDRRFGEDDTKVVNELKRFGIDKLSLLDEILSDSFIERFKQVTPYNGNYLSFLRIVMIVSDLDKYFKEAKSKKFKFMSTEFINVLDHFGISMVQLRKYNMMKKVK